jgi:hypothetical protein
VISRTGRVGVVIGDDLEPFATAQLPCQFAPERADLGAVGLLVNAAWRNRGSHQDSTANAWELRDPGRLKDGLDTREVGGCHAREQVKQSKQGVRLATAEIGLKRHGRISPDRG